jgi:hypothetical protein
VTALVCDVLGTATFAGAAFYWGKLALQSSKPKHPIGFIDGPVRRSQQWKSSLGLGAGVLVLLILTVWFALPIARKASQPQWKVCGTVATSCSSAYCIVGLDDRYRQVSPACVPPRDPSGYLVLESSDWVSYRPKYLRIQCDGKELSVVNVPASFFSSRCDGLLEVK